MRANTKITTKKVKCPEGTPGSEYMTIHEIHMDETSIKNERILAEGVRVLNDSRVSGLNANDLIIGGSGSGKTGGVLFRLLMYPTCSMIVSDTKGRLYKMFANYLKEKGFKVKLLDFVRPEDSMAYNPFDYLGRDQNGKYLEKDVKKLAKIIMPVLDRKDPFWEKAGIRYITMIMAYVLDALPAEEQNLTSVIRLHQELVGGSGKEMLQEFAELHPDTLAARKYKEMCETDKAEKMWASILEFANEALDPFTYGEYDNIFGREDEIHLEDLGKEKTVLFINCSDNDTSFHVLSNVLNAQALQTLIMSADKNDDGKLPVPVRIILDDFSAGPQMDEFDNIISIIRSRDISVSVIIQSISQLRSRYGNEAADTIMNNCDHILYLSGHDITTAQYLAHYVDRTPGSILNKPREEAILITDGEKARFVKKLTPYPEDCLAVLRSVKPQETEKEADATKSSKEEGEAGKQLSTLETAIEIRRMMEYNKAHGTEVACEMPEEMVLASWQNDPYEGFWEEDYSLYDEDEISQFVPTEYTEEELIEMGIIHICKNESDEQ